MEQKPLFIVIIIASCLIFLLTIISLIWKITALEHKLNQSPLSENLNNRLQNLPPDVASMKVVKQQLETAQQDLLVQIKSEAINQTLLSQQVENLRKLLDVANADMIAVSNNNKRLSEQLDNTHQAVEKLVQALQAKEQALKQLVPVGTVIAYSGAVDNEQRTEFLRAGWLVCDGESYLVQSYPELAKQLGKIYGGDGKERFKVPDFRGVFLRGLDAGRGLDAKRVLGALQDDQNKNHSHSGKTEAAGAHEHQAKAESAGKHDHDINAGITSSMMGADKSVLTPTAGSTETSTAGEHNHLVRIESAGKHQHDLQINSEGGNEARPKNYAVVYLIKF